MTVGDSSIHPLNGYFECQALDNKPLFEIPLIHASFGIYATTCSVNLAFKHAKQQVPVSVYRPIYNVVTL